MPTVLQTIVMIAWVALLAIAVYWYIQIDREYKKIARKADKLSEELDALIQHERGETPVKLGQGTVYVNGELLGKVVVEATPERMDH